MRSHRLATADDHDATGMLSRRSLLQAGGTGLGSLALSWLVSRDLQAGLAAPHHPAYEPLDMKALGRSEGGDDRPRPSKFRHRDAEEGGERRKPRSRADAPAGAVKKKAPKKNKPSRAERKATKSNK